jgi:ADP-heptose:LPS heptosyltransferase
MKVVAEAIIIFRIGSLGDTIVALPCFHRIARSFPNSRRIVVTNVPASEKAASVESILGRSGLIDGIIPFPPAPRKSSDFLKLRDRIRENQARTLVYIADRGPLSMLRDICFFRSCGIRKIIGASWSADHRLPRVDPDTGYLEREAVRLTRCLSSLGPIDLDDPESWDLRLQKDEIAVAERELASLGGSDFISLSVGGKVRDKDWGDDNWIALLRLLALEHSNLALVFFGSVDEFDRSTKLETVWPGEKLNLCGVLTPRESAAAIKRATLFVGHDNGPMHLAAAMGVPCVGIFGNFNKPKWWHPLGQGHRIIHNMKGVREISPEEVHAAVCLTVAQVSARTIDHKFGDVLEGRSLQTKSYAGSI